MNLMSVNVRPSHPIPPGRQRPASIIGGLSTEERADSSPSARRLESWKEIAAYLNRSERTVRRWEDKEGLPVHRLQHDKRGSVYAYASELEAWRDSRQPLILAETTDAGAPDGGTRGRVTRWVMVSAALVLTLLGAFLLANRRTPAPAPPRPEAVRALRQAEFASNAGRVQILHGIRYYQEAIRFDPSFAKAWSGLAAAHMAQTWFGDFPAKETMAQAKREAQQALQLHPLQSDAWRVLAGISHYWDWNHTGAEEHFRKAIDLEPTSSVALSWFAEFLMDLRRFDEAAVYARRAQEAAPRWLEPITVSGNIHAFTGHADLAIAEYRRVLETEPNFGLANHFLGRALLMTGDYPSAVDQLRKSNELLGEVPFSIARLGHALAITGARAVAEEMVANLIQKREQGFYPAFAIAEIQIGLGNLDAALEWLEHAVDERHVGYYLPSVDPIYDPLRSHPRFEALMGRMNLTH